MLRKLRERAQDEKGFTLIELLVVILIIGILAAIAIPSFLNQRSKGNDAEAKSTAVTAAEAMETCATDNNGSYTSCTLASIRAIEPTLNDAGARLSVSSGASNYTVIVTSNRDSQRGHVHPGPRRDRHHGSYVCHRLGRQGWLLGDQRRHLVVQESCKRRKRAGPRARPFRSALCIRANRRVKGPRPRTDIQFDAPIAHRTGGPAPYEGGARVHADRAAGRPDHHRDPGGDRDRRLRDPAEQGA